METQISINFESPQLLFGTHPLKYHLLRVGSGEMAGKFWHQNSIWEGYNSSGYPDSATESRLSKYVNANSSEDIVRILEVAANESLPNRTWYILAKMRCETYQCMPQFIV